MKSRPRVEGIRGTGRFHAACCGPRRARSASGPPFLKKASVGKHGFPTGASEASDAVAQ
jgi:hypothetical protein